jgi:cyclase
VSVEYTKGLHELGDGMWAYLQPRGQWGYSNAGLVAGDGDSLLVDTLFDLQLTRQMLEQMKPITDTRPISSLVNTHANGDHCFGNELVPERAKIYATVACAEEMAEVPPSRIEGLKEAIDFAAWAFGPFDFTDITGRAPDETFDSELTLTIGGRDVIVRDLGPAHTRSDSVVIVPSARAVFTGDLVFNGGTPIAWAGPISNWQKACETIAGLDVDWIVPGHGPVATAQDVLDVKRYFDHVVAEATKRQQGGMDAVEAAFDIDLGEFASVPDSERIVVTVQTIYRDNDPSHPAPDPVLMWEKMGEYHHNHAKGS